MTIKFNGTNTAAAPGVTGADTDTGLVYGTNQIDFSTGGTTRATVNSAGKLGLGTTSPRRQFHLHESASATVGFQMTNGNTGESNDSQGFQLKVGSDSHAEIAQMENSHLGFFTNASERMRIDSSGKVLVGITSAVTGAAGVIQALNVSYVVGSSYRTQTMSGDGNLYFWNGTNQGYLNSSGSWIDASDVNLKKDITDLTYGIDVLKNLKPRKYKMKADDKEQIGFIAQEVETVLPEVTDTSKTPDEDQHKGIAYGHLTAVLTKALQEAIAKIEVLETKVAALEAG
tara:strand:+ start:336 stop:1193 length:858 start_codon:yes stop_codon:yes gene_type:complete